VVPAKRKNGHTWLIKMAPNRAIVAANHSGNGFEIHDMRKTLRPAVFERRF
jgi:hypothetical protein